MENNHHSYLRKLESIVELSYLRKLAGIAGHRTPSPKKEGRPRNTEESKGEAEKKANRDKRKFSGSFKGV